MIPEEGLEPPPPKGLPGCYPEDSAFTNSATLVWFDDLSELRTTFKGSSRAECMQVRACDQAREVLWSAGRRWDRRMVRMEVAE